MNFQGKIWIFKNLDLLSPSLTVSLTGYWFLKRHSWSICQICGDILKLSLHYFVMKSTVVWKTDTIRRHPFVLNAQAHTVIKQWLFRRSIQTIRQTKHYISEYTNSIYMNVFHIFIFTTFLKPLLRFFMNKNICNHWKNILKYILNQFETVWLSISLSW